MASKLGLTPRSEAAALPEGNAISFPWRELLEVVFRKRWIIISAAVMGLLVAAVLAWRVAPVYKAQARVMLTAQPGSGTLEGAMPDKQIKAQLAMLKSPALIRGVLDSYGEEASGGRLQVTPEAVAAMDPEVISGRIEAELMDKSNMVQLTFADRDPRWAARFINGLLAQHIDKVARLNEQISTHSFFEQQRELAALRWIEAREALTQFRELQGANLLTGDVNQLRSVITDLEAQRVDAETQVLQLQAKVEFLSREINNYPETVDAETRLAENESTTLLKSRILELEMERSDLRSRYTAKSTAIRNINRKIEEAKRLLEEKGTSVEIVSETTTEVNPSFQNMEIGSIDARAQLTEAEARVKALSDQLTRYRGKLGELERVAAELERLQNEVESARLADENYRQREEEARLSAALDESRIVPMIIVERALVPSKPESSNRRLKVLIGMVAGLLIGTGWAFFKDWWDPSVKSRIQAERLIDLPVLAEIPSR